MRTNSRMKCKQPKKLRKNVTIGNETIREAWNSKQSLRKNLAQIGLSNDPNKLFGNPNQTMDIMMTAKQITTTSKTNTNVLSTNKLIQQRLLKQKQRIAAKKSRRLQTKCKLTIAGTKEFNKEPQAQAKFEETETDTKSTKISVADILAEQAISATKIVGKKFRFGLDNVKFCAYMIEKYGDNYEAMCWDPMNRYQESTGQIRSKIRKFLSIPEHQRVYSLAKQMANDQIKLDCRIIV